LGNHLFREFNIGPGGITGSQGQKAEG